ncbi:MAG: biopolymer transporter ExbD [Deltaproteobacteria bacterium]|nr:biopolymer transporter ExbD [Deltaproteobacteria bacterium]
MEPTTSLSITSMMDMFTIILVFLLVFFEPEARPDPEFQLPSSVATQQAADGTTLRVRRDAIEVNGSPVLPLVDGDLGNAARDGRRVLAVLGALEAARAQVPGGELPLMVECDQAVPWSTLGDLLATAADAGFQSYRFVVLGGAERPIPPTGSAPSQVF